MRAALAEYESIEKDPYEDGSSKAHLHVDDRAAEVNGPIPDPRRAIYQRTPADYATLKSYADQLNADVIGVQEVDGTVPLAKVFDSGRYQLIMTDEDDYQRPGLAIRKGLRFTRHTDLASLDLLAGQPRSLRRGLDVTVHLPGGDMRVLVVHLKSGCFSEASKKGEACEQIAQQIPMLAEWIDQRQAADDAFVVMGDFNRRLGLDGDPLWKLLDNGPVPLALPTGPMRSSCWGGEYPDLIDHVILGGRAATRLRAGGAEMLVFKETDKADKKVLSDHCPVSVRLAG